MARHAATHTLKHNARYGRKANRCTPRRFSLDGLEARTLLSVTLDPVFGSAGMSIGDFAAATDEAYAVHALPDGKYLVAGKASDPAWNSDFALVRYNADGTLDTSFGGGDGVVATDFSGSFNDVAFAMTVQADGKIVLAGQMDAGSDSYDFAVARYDADGSLDESFGGTGMVHTDFANSFDQAFAVVQDASGRLVVAGLASDSGGNFCMAVARYNDDGSLDLTFSGDGKRHVNVGEFGGTAYALAMDGDKIVIGGYGYNANGSDFAVARLNADGSLDTAFGGTGVVVHDAGGDDDVVRALAVIDGAVVAAGKANMDFAVAKFTAAGMIDQGFGGADANAQHVLLVDMSDGGNDGAFAMAVDGAGRLLVGGTVDAWGDANAGVIRLNADGTMDVTFDNDGKVVVTFGSMEDNVRGMAVDASGNVVLAGWRYDMASDYDWVTARLLLAPPPPPNVAPVADAGTGYSVNEGSSVSLSGAASSDSDGTIVSWEWDFDYDGSTFDADATGMSPLFSAAGLDGPTVRTVALRVTDDDGAVHIVTVNVTVVNVAPAASAGTDQTVVAGTQVSLSGGHTDAGAADTHSYSWDVLHNGQSVASGAGASFSFTPSAAGTYVVTLTVTDDDGASATSTVTVTATQPPPPPGFAANAGRDQEGVEGTRVMLSGGVTGATADIVSWQWRLISADNGQVIADGSAQNFSFTPADNGVYVLELTVTDANGAVVSDRVMVSVANAAPVVRVGDDRAGNEGTRQSITGRFTDAGSADTHAFLWTVRAGNGQVVESGTSTSFSFVPMDNGTYTVKFKVTDDDGASGCAKMIITVRNVAPTVRLPLDRAAREGQTISFTPTMRDPGALDTHAYDWQVLMGGVVVASGDTQAVSFVAADNGLYTVNYSATDDDGGAGSDSMMVEADNVRPEVQMSRGVTVIEGTPVSLSGSFFDEGPADTHVMSWTVVASNGQHVASGSAADFSFTPMDQGRYDVTFTVTDDDGASGWGKVTVWVKNDKPRVALAGPASGVRGQTLGYMGGFVDAGPMDTHEVMWDFGDGTRTDWMPATAENLRMSHVFASSGKRTIKMTVRDGADETTAKYNVEIKAAELQQDPADFNKWALMVGGTNSSERIEFRRGTQAGTVAVYINNKHEGTFNPTGRLYAYGQGGDDTILIGQGVGHQGVFHGGAGNDTLAGGLNDDVLVGGDGADEFWASGGMDQMIQD